MTADERIEKLLNRFGQTISDLPKPTLGQGDVEEMAYGWWHRDSAGKAVVGWFPADWLTPKDVIISACLDYVCHLCDVIDRMETALETATNTMDCLRCQMGIPNCYSNCNEHSKVADWQLSGMYKSEFKEFMEGQSDE